MKYFTNLNKTLKKTSRYKSNTRNPHHYDEMPKNSASKDVYMYCSSVEWLCDPTSFGGHRTRKTGHRQVSGIVRAGRKKELRKILKDEL